MGFNKKLLNVQSGAAAEVSSTLLLAV